MEKVISKDGTPIAYDKVGDGPTVILVGGALGVRAYPGTVELAQQLSSHFTAINFDRRGRGDSGDTQPYAVAREIEDIEALIDAEGGTAYVYGMSSGAALALEAANALPAKIKKAALYEPPFIVDDTHPPLPDNYIGHLKDLVAAGRRGDAVEYFMVEAVGVPAEYIAPMRADPMWAGMESVAHTIHYDGTIMGENMSGKPLRPNQWPAATMPVLLMAGGESPAFFHNGADAAAQQLANAQRRTLPGQTHGVANEVLVPVLVEFFTQ